MAVENITILGATGSIGRQTLAVLAKHPERFCVFALSAQSNVDLLFQQCRQFTPRYAVIGSPHYLNLKARFQQARLPTTLLSGEQALSDIATDADVNQVVAAIVGGAGLLPTYAAVKAGKRLLLANKEALVMTGQLFIQAAKASGACILPLDSEHNALFQCMPSAQGFRQASLSQAGISRLLLTGSGGPFRQTPLSELPHKTPEQACSHPNWEMGKKISVDSATMMNKGLEYIEAKTLFDAQPEELDVIIHPQSVIHSLVQYQDGSSLAQIGHSDMRVPIAHALSYPKRIVSGVEDIDLTAHQLTFEPVDYKRYPCLKLAIDIADNNRQTTLMNAANEIAVDAFLNKQITFTDIYPIVEQTLMQDKQANDKLTAFDQVISLDDWARQTAQALIQKRG